MSRAELDALIKALATANVGPDARKEVTRSVGEALMLPAARTRGGDLAKHPFGYMIEQDEFQARVEGAG